MDDRTEALGDLFESVTGAAEVTAEQAEGRGTLAGEEGDVDARLGAVVDAMRERYDFATDLDRAAYCRVVREFFDGTGDAAVAAALEVDAATVRRARLDLHLLRAGDAGPVDLAALARACSEHEELEAVAAALGADVPDLERALPALAARNEARRASGRYRREFAEILTDADLATSHTAAVTETGLEEAVADAETDLEL